MEESRNVSDKYMVSISLTFITELLLSPGLDSLSHGFNKRKSVMYKQCKTVDIGTYITKEYMFIYLFDKALERYEENIVWFRLLNRL